MGLQNILAVLLIRIAAWENGEISKISNYQAQNWFVFEQAIKVVDIHEQSYNQSFRRCSSHAKWNTSYPKSSSMAGLRELLHQYIGMYRFLDPHRNHLDQRPAVHDKLVSMSMGYKEGCRLKRAADGALAGQFAWEEFEKL